MNLTCKYCSTDFTAKRGRQCCDRSCSAKLATLTKGKNPWRQAEKDVINRLLGSMPAPAIVKAVQQLDKSKGWPVRTDTAVMVHLKRHYGSVVAVYDNFNRSQLAIALDIDRERVRQWTRHFDLPFSKWACSNSAITLKDFRQWAFNHPQQLAGIECDRLNWFLNDTDFCERVEILLYAGAGIRKAVQNLDTGVIYKSIRAAAADCYVTKRGIPQAIARNGRSGGYRWAYVEEAIA